MRAVFHCRECAEPLPEGETDCPICGLPLIPPGDHRAAADRGDPEAQFLLGLRHRGGFGAPLDLAEAERWFRLAAEQGHAPAQRELGLLYLTDRSPPEGERVGHWTLLAARQGYQVAMDDVAFLYDARNPMFDDDEAMPIIARCPGNLAAITAGTRGFGLVHGLVGHRDAELGWKWLQLAADKGCMLSQHEVGMRHLRGDGVPQDLAAAERWLRLAADRGHDEAQLHLGLMYREGTGVEADQFESARLLGLAAAQGNNHARVIHAFNLIAGSGVPEDAPAGLHLMHLAAADGFASAQLILGWMYRGGLTVGKDLAAGARLHRRAAEQMDPDAQLSLGEMCQLGMGVDPDEVEAARWLQLAVEAKPSLASTYGSCWGAAEMVEAEAWLLTFVERGEAWAATLLAALREGKRPEGADAGKE